MADEPCIIGGVEGFPAILCNDEERESLVTDVTNMFKQHGELQEQLRAAVQARSDAEKGRQAAEKVQGALKVERDEAVKQRDIANAKVATQDEHLRQIEQLQKQVNLTEDARKRLETLHDAVKKERDDGARQLGELNEKVGRLEQQVRELQESIEAKDQSIKELEAEVRKCRDSINALQAELNSAGAQMQKMASASRKRQHTVDLGGEGGLFKFEGAEVEEQEPKRSRTTTTSLFQKYVDADAEVPDRINDTVQSAFTDITEDIPVRTGASREELRKAWETLQKRFKAVRCADFNCAQQPEESKDPECKTNQTVAAKLLNRLVTRYAKSSATHLSDLIEEGKRDEACEHLLMVLRAKLFANNPNAVFAPYSRLTFE